MRLSIFEDFDEQALVCFTGKLNILSLPTNQFLGEIIFYEGEIINAKMGAVEGLKALVNLCLEREKENGNKLVVEPELIDSIVNKINTPLGDLKRRLAELCERYIETAKQRPPSRVKLVARAEVIESKIDISPSEFSLLCTLSDYSLVDDVYQHNEMFDYEITEALGSLRQKEILKVIKLT